VAYITAIRMLEAVLENDEEISPRKRSNSESTAKSGSTEDEAINGVEAEDRKVVVKLVASIRARLTALRKKLALMSKRQSAPPMAPAKAIAHHPPMPTIATTPPK